VEQDQVNSDDESHLLSRKTLSEIQNITVPLKRKDENLDLIKNVKLKFIKCANITINITKE
jgi:hypothetical protein